jgi:predicted RNA-binding protein with PUA-like domain
MAHWLLKTEPSDWSWADQVKAGRAAWSGVRNPQALNNLKAMEKDEACFFYHTGNERAIVGIVRVAKPFYPDHSDATGKAGCIDVKAGGALKTPVTLAALKQDPALKGFALLRQGRHSVVPVPDPMWRHICRLGGIKP